jgi:hypothetical protein
MGKPGESTAIFPLHLDLEFFNGFIQGIALDMYRGHSQLAHYSKANLTVSMGDCLFAQGTPDDADEDEDDFDEDEKEVE